MSSAMGIPAETNSMDGYGPFCRGDKTRCIGKLFGGAPTLRQNSNLEYGPVTP